eukprot:4908332-Amphidinium_carterae.1
MNSNSAKINEHKCKHMSMAAQQEVATLAEEKGMKVSLCCTRSDLLRLGMSYKRIDTVASKRDFTEEQRQAVIGNVLTTC